MNSSIRYFVLLCIIINCSELILSTPLKSTNQNIPQLLKHCHKNDPNLNECLRNAIESVRANLTYGIPELLIPPCEPLKVPEIRIKQNAGAIRMESEYSNIIIYGLSNFTLRNIYVDPIQKSLRADLWFPILRMTSNYAIQGKVLLMPLMGNGTSSGNFTDVDATITMKKKDVSIDENENEKTDRIGDINVEFNIGGASVHLDNLFNGDPELGAMMNIFLNNNWREITAEIRPALGESIENILYGIVKQLNEKYDLKNLLNA